MLSDY